MRMNPNSLWFRGIATILVGAFSLAVLPAESFAGTGSNRSKATFRPGDALRLTVWELRWSSDGQGLNLDFNDNYPIDDQGKIQVPVIGEVEVVGYNQQTLAKRLRELLSPYFAEPPVVVVEPLIRVTVMGALNRPGSYLISPRRSLWDLIDAAGGPSEDANLPKMRVDRGGQVVKANLLSGYEKGVSLRELGIRSGDQVMVPPRSRFTVRDFMDYTRFAISIAILYLQIKRTR